MKSKNALKPINILKNGGFEFELDGKIHKFFFEPHISVERYRAMQKIELEMSYALSFKSLHGGLKELYASMNKMEFVESAVKLRDLIEGTHRIDDEANYPSIMRYSALILNTEDEKRTIYDEQLINSKIDLWVRGGVPIQSFFQIALHSVNGLMENYKENTLNSSTKVTEVKK